MGPVRARAVRRTFGRRGSTLKATVAGYLASLPDRSNRIYTVTGSDGEIVVVETDGLASAHDGALDSALAFTSRASVSMAIASVRRERGTGR